MHCASALAAVIVIGAAAAEARPNPPQAMREVGLLTCMPDGGVGAALGSSRRVHCTFEAYSRTQMRESYVGYLEGAGADSGGDGQAISWSVRTAGGGARYGMLTGLFSGPPAAAPSSEADVLFGCRGEGVVLAPVGRAGEAGPNLALGATSLELRPARSGDAPAPSAQPR